MAEKKEDAKKDKSADIESAQKIKRTKTTEIPPRKFTIPILIPVILFIATIIQLYMAGKSLWDILDLAEGIEFVSSETQAVVNNAIISAIVGIVGTMLLYIFLWGVLYYLYKASGNKLFSIS